MVLIPHNFRAVLVTARYRRVTELRGSMCTHRKHRELTDRLRQCRRSLHYLGAMEADIPECPPTSTRHGELGILGEGQTKSPAPEMHNAQVCARMTREARAVLTSRVYERSVRADGVSGCRSLEFLCGRGRRSTCMRCTVLQVLK